MAEIHSLDAEPGLNPALKKYNMKCCACGHEWQDLEGGWGMHFRAGCPNCNNLYWTCDKYKGV